MENQSTITSFTLDKAHRYHFVGIGGIGMSAIAQILLARGIQVSGSDARPSSILDRLKNLGAEIHLGHDAHNLTHNDVLVLSDAIKPENPEWQQAVAWNLPIIKRADLLGYLTNSGRGVAVSGTHGKTTTSGMLALIFTEAGLDPTCILGGELAPLGGNARPGSDLTLVEACEAYNSFLDLYPEAAVLTNIDVDHLDFHGTPEHLFDSFRQFLRQVKRFAVMNGDDPRLRTMTALPPKAITYGTGAECDYRISDVQLSGEPSFTLQHGNDDLGRLTLRVPGMHNIYNAAGATALALELGARIDDIRNGLAKFPGMHRRFERLGQLNGVAIVDDYAHHPTEIRATLAAARGAFSGQIVAVFQPHLFSRTRDLLEDFAHAFSQADIILIAPIYPAREAPIPGVTHDLLVQRLQTLCPEKPVVSLSSLTEGVAMLTHAAHGIAKNEHTCAIPSLHHGDVIITIGAGDVDTIAQTLTQSQQ
ncbi:MAG TPA: UDP-N-acetylmuramate--L-alanine ligase [Armatimonadota bacterium]|nr:UDP-N-acetylmuramate--L-alanine ligase [Armatimonadota bacterium]